MGAMVGGVERYDRFVSSWVQELLRNFPVVMIQGARQVGKSTLTQMLDNPVGTQFVTMDDELDRHFVEDDPAAFLSQDAPRVVIDEIQRVPELILAIKRHVDRHDRPGQLILTGSANLLRIPGAEDSLAGRAVSVDLEPLAEAEIQGARATWVDRFLAGDGLGDGETLSRGQLAEMLGRGGYPRPLNMSHQVRASWLRDYARRLVERDALDLARIDVANMYKLLEWVGATTSEELVKEKMAETLGISRPTVARYLEHLKTLFLVREVPVWSHNQLKRVVSRPKILLNDTGLAAALAHDSVDMLAWPRGGERLGSLLETFVVNELIKQSHWAKNDYRVGHFRSREGSEVDAVVELPHGIVAVEVKTTSAPKTSHFRHLKQLRDSLGDEFLGGVVVNTGRAAQAGDRLWAVPVPALWSGH